MKLLLDTHAFLWFVAGDDDLSAPARRKIESRRDEKYLSLASVWEIAIKVSLGKIRLGMTVSELVDTGALDNGIHLLDISRAHVEGVALLPFHHRDPFDRLLIAQALAEEMIVVGRDDAFDAYHIKRVW